MWNWNLDRNLIIILLIMGICTMLFEKLYTTLRWKEPRRQEITNFSFKMFKRMRSLRSSKCLKTTVELTFTTQKANAFSHWTACSVFKSKYLFWVNLVQKLKIISYMQNFMVMFTFSVFDWKSLFGQIWCKKSKLSVCAEICTLD